MKFKELLKTEQPKIYSTLEYFFQSNKIPHAFLIVGDQASEVAEFIAKSIICENDIFACEECNECKRIDERNYPDFIVYDGKEEIIKKEMIHQIHKRFSITALEDQARIYILNNIEYSTDNAMNSLLKTLEEPEKGVYSIFTTNNINRVLPTIQSRCIVLHLESFSNQSFKEDLIQYHCPKDLINVFLELYDHIDDCKDLIGNEDFDNLVQEVFYFIDDLFNKRDNLIIDVETHLLKKYKDKDSIHLFLNMLVLGLRDMFHVKHSLPLTFPSFKSLYEKINVEDIDILNKIEIVLNTDYLIDSNANINLLMDSLMYEL